MAHRKDFIYLVGGVLVMVMVGNECSPELLQRLINKAFVISQRGAVSTRAIENP